TALSAVLSPGRHWSGPTSPEPAQDQGGGGRRDYGPSHEISSPGSVHGRIVWRRHGGDPRRRREPDEDRGDAGTDQRRQRWRRLRTEAGPRTGAVRGTQPMVAGPGPRRVRDLLAPGDRGRRRGGRLSHARDRPQRGEWTAVLAVALHAGRRTPAQGIRPSGPRSRLCRSTPAGRNRVVHQLGRGRGNSRALLPRLRLRAHR